VRGFRRTFAATDTPKDECNVLRPVSYCPDHSCSEEPSSSGVASHKPLRLSACPKVCPHPRRPQGAFRVSRGVHKNLYDGLRFARISDSGKEKLGIVANFLGISHWICWENSVKFLWISWDCCLDWQVCAGDKPGAGQGRIKTSDIGGVA
jgi:hypothetical protein